MIQANHKKRTEQIEANLAEAQQICNKIQKMKMASFSREKSKEKQSIKPKHKLIHNYKVDCEYSFENKKQQKEKR